MIFASVVALAGDTVAQNAVEGKQLFSDQDHVRTFRMACFSTFVWTPLGYKWLDLFSNISTTVHLGFYSPLAFGQKQLWRT